LIAAIEQIFPAALRQRCLIHRLRNTLAKTPAGMQAEIRDGYWALFDTEGLKTEPGPRLVEPIDYRMTEFVDHYRATYPAAMKILDTDRAGLTAHLRFPTEHHHRIRHSNFIDRHRQPAGRRRRECQYRRLTSPRNRNWARPPIYPKPDGRWRSGSGSKQRKGGGWPPLS
jgi:putative transposase